MTPLSFKQIIHRLKNANLPETDLVIGIGNGGVVPAALAAFFLHADLKIIILNYRDEQNNPRHDDPAVISLPEDFHPLGKRILLVDDVSVSGKTMMAARKLLGEVPVKTLVMKGKADFVLFPEIKECVAWPWKP